LPFRFPHLKLADNRRWFLFLGLVAVVAILLRIIYLAELRHTPPFAVLIGDARQYDYWAQEIAGGQWIGHEVFYQTPLYPYFLAIIFKLAGHQLIVVRVVQAFLGAASCVLLGSAGERFFDRRVGLISAALLAIYPPAIFFDGLIQKSSLDLFLMSAMLAALSAFVTRTHWKWLIPAGAALGLLTLNRENARVLIPIVIVWLLINFRQSNLRRRIGLVAIFSAAMALVLLPVGFRNYRVGGEFLISTSQLGPNLFIGNHPGAGGSYEPLVPGHGNAAYERDDARQLAETAMGRKLSPNEVSNYWVRRSLDYVKSQPGQWLRLMGRKFLLTFTAKEVVDTESIEAYADYSILLRGLLWFSFGVILPLAVFGAWLTRKDSPRLWILYAMFAGLAIAVAIFYVVARYRYPLVPIAIMFAAAGLSSISKNWRQPKRLGVAPLVAALVIAVPINVWPRMSEDETKLNIGEELVRMGQPAQAIPILQEAVKDSPEYAPAHFNLGVAFNAAGRKDEALDEFGSAITLMPNYFDAQAAMALTLLETGRPVGAIEHFREAARLRPDLPAIHRDLGNALMRADKRADALAAYQAALNLNPNDAATHNGIAIALQQDGKIDEAIQHYEAALKLKPDDAGTHSNLAIALDDKGNHDAAMAHLQRAVQLDPDNVGIRANFGDLLSRLNRFDEAIEQYEQAVRLSGDSLEMLLRLAQLYAAAHRFDNAVATLEKAAAQTRAAGAGEATAQIEQAISAYRARMPKSPPAK
jgi:tetratricopeptide (TPR) repeat protein